MSVQNFITFEQWEVHTISPRIRLTFSYRSGFPPLAAWGWTIFSKFKQNVLDIFKTFPKHILDFM